MAVKAIVTVTRPVLTEEERAERMKRLEQAMINFWIAVERRQAEQETKQE